jgi:hypothetical protein
MSSHVTTDSLSIGMSWCRVHAALEGLYLNECYSDIRSIYSKYFPKEHYPIGVCNDDKG